MLTVGVAVELFLFIFFWGTTAFYVRRANSEFDAMTQDLIRDAWKENK
jgi:cation/acetate symporter